MLYTNRQTDRQTNGGRNINPPSCGGCNRAKDRGRGGGGRTIDVFVLRQFASDADDAVGLVRLNNGRTEVHTAGRVINANGGDIVGDDWGQYCLPAGRRKSLRHLATDY